MTSGGISIGGIGAAMPAATVQFTPVGAATSMIAGSGGSDMPSSGVVVTISDGALKAFALDSASPVTGTNSMASSALNDLAAAALLAILLDEDDKKNDSSTAAAALAAAAAIKAYLLVQSLG